MKLPLFYLSLAFMLIATGCKKNTELCDPTPVFSMDEFVNQLETRMTADSIIGWQYAINSNKGNLYRERSFGLARHGSDPGGPVSITSNTRFNVASISKFVGAIALLNVMEDNNISMDFDIAGYLPKSWDSAIHPGNKNVSFKDILTNETGINFPGSTPPSGSMPTEAQMLQALSIAPNLSRVGTYQNGNFTLIRVLIGEIVYKLDEEAADYATKCTERYFNYIKTNIFSKLNLNCPGSVSEVVAYYNSSSYPYAYQHPFWSGFRDVASGSLGWAHSNSPYRNGGSAGLMMSAVEIAKIMAYFKHDQSELIISKARRKNILDHELGLTESTTGMHGRYHAKGGTRGPDDCCDRAIKTRIMFFPNDVEVVVITNSDFDNIISLLREAYDASWLNPCN